VCCAVTLSCFVQICKMLSNTGAYKSFTMPETTGLSTVVSINVVDCSRVEER